MSVRTIGLNDVLNEIVDREYHRVGNRTTICVLKLKFDMEVIGISQCQNIKHDDPEKGRTAASDDAIDKCFPLVIAHYRNVDRSPATK